MLKTAFILAGGLGTRLQSVVSDKPKPLAEVNGKPFLQLLLKQLDKSGLRRAILCTGYLASQVEETFGNKFGNLELVYSAEKERLGTAGALRNALGAMQDKVALVLNGDSYCQADLSAFYAFYEQQQAEAAMLLIKMADSERYGRVQIDNNKRVTSFVEKGQTGSGLVNAGIYILSRNILDALPVKIPASLERDVFPDLAKQGMLSGYEAETKVFIDIGTPASYSAAQDLLADFV